MTDYDKIILIPSKMTSQRFNDYQIYKELFYKSGLHENTMRAVFGVGCFYEHYNELLNNLK